MRMDSDVISAIGSITSGITAIISLIIAALAWRTSANAASATEALTRIERIRLHGERRPEFDITLEWVAAEEPVLLLRAILIGPKAVLRVEQARFVMQPIKLPMLPNGKFDYTITPIDVYPYDFEWVPGSGVHANSTSPTGVEHGQSILGWVTPSKMAQGQILIGLGLPKLAFTIECVTSGFEPWVIPGMADIPPQRRQVPSTRKPQQVQESGQA